MADFRLRVTYAETGRLVMLSHPRLRAPWNVRCAAPGCLMP